MINERKVIYSIRKPEFLTISKGIGNLPIQKQVG